MACFVIFEPTFGNPLKKLDFTKVTFLGPILQTIDLSINDNYREFVDKGIGRQARILKPRLLLDKKKDIIFLESKSVPIKPLVAVTLNREKITFISNYSSNIANTRKKETTIIFYPPLPYSFLLYFQDRQIAHIEFMFYISDNGKIGSIKRKISSGNLDVDLLSLRYITHCLSLVEGKFPSNTWQTVKIDLTRKNDDK
jgi:hypothetical protein